MTPDKSHNQKLEEKREQKKKKNQEQTPIEKREVVMHGAKLKCQYAKGPGKLVVTSNEILLQDQKWATVNDDSNMVNLQFKGTCGHPKWPNQKMPPPPCMSVIKLSPWQKIGTTIVQEQTVLVKESFINCEPDFNSAVAKPIPKVASIAKKLENEIEYVNGHFYNTDGTFEGKVNEASNTGVISDVYTCTGTGKGKDKDGKEIDVYKGIKLLKENGENVKHDVFANNSYLIYHEASTAGNAETALWIAHTVNNALNSNDFDREESTFNNLFKTGYSSIESADKSKKIATSSNNDSHKFARKAMIDVLNQGTDPTNSAYFWDGLDLFTRTKELEHRKFKEYKSVTILSSHLQSALDFWGIDSNKAKVNSKSIINNIFLEKYELKKVIYGAIINNDVAFSGSRTNSNNNSAIRFRIKSTGFKSGTIFWTTSNI